MYIHSCSTYVGNPEKTEKELKKELQNYSDYYFRRANKFIILSLLGSNMCLQNVPYSEKVSIYLSTENGNLGDTENVLNQLYRNGSFPKPFNFINTMSNTAAFYVAQSLKSNGRNITVSSKMFSFERGLELAMLDIATGTTKEALVGGVDEASFSNEQFEEKYNLNSDAYALVDGSSWIYLKSENDGAVGEIIDIKNFNLIDDISDYLNNLDLKKNLILSYGIFVKEEEKNLFKNTLNSESEFNYINNNGYYDTSTSCGLAEFFEKYKASCLIHINKDQSGSYSIIVVEKY